MKIDWKRKLTSRKFWIAIVGFITPLLLAFGVAEETATEIAGIIMAGASAVAYIIGEGLADAGHKTENEAPEEEPESTDDGEI